MVGAQYATGDKWRNNSRRNEVMEPKQNQHPIVDVTGDTHKSEKNKHPETRLNVVETAVL